MEELHAWHNFFFIYIGKKKRCGIGRSTSFMKAMILWRTMLITCMQVLQFASKALKDDRIMTWPPLHLT